MYRTGCQELCFLNRASSDRLAATDRQAAAGCFRQRFWPDRLVPRAKLRSRTGEAGSRCLTSSRFSQAGFSGTGTLCDPQEGDLSGCRIDSVIRSWVGKAIAPTDVAFRKTPPPPNAQPINRCLRQLAGTAAFRGSGTGLDRGWTIRPGSIHPRVNDPLSPRRSCSHLPHDICLDRMKRGTFPGGCSGSMGSHSSRKPAGAERGP